MEVARLGVVSGNHALGLNIAFIFATVGMHPSYMFRVLMLKADSCELPSHFACLIVQCLFWVDAFWWASTCNTEIFTLPPHNYKTIHMDHFVSDFLVSFPSSPWPANCLLALPVIVVILFFQLLCNHLVSIALRTYHYQQAKFCDCLWYHRLWLREQGHHWNS